MRRFYEDGEMDEINRRFNEGGILYFIERTDTHQFFYEPLRMKTTADPYIPDEYVDWSDTIHFMMILSGGFLTKEAAEKENNFTECGCRYCGNGSKKIPTIVTEHEFVFQSAVAFKNKNNGCMQNDDYLKCELPKGSCNLCKF